MKIVSENRFSGKTYFYAISSRLVHEESRPRPRSSRVGGGDGVQRRDSGGGEGGQERRLPGTSDLRGKYSASLPAYKCPRFSFIWQNSTSYVQYGASGCEKEFVKCFLKLPFTSLGSVVAGVPFNGLSIRNSQKTFSITYLTPQTVSYAR